MGAVVNDAEVRRSQRTKSASNRFPPHEVRDDFIPKEDYLSNEFAQLEAQRLWPRVWQVACRLEELANVGDYVSYDILGDSIILVRSSDAQIKAYHNACPHRGTRLTRDCGRLKQFVCRFHGWRFDLDGNNTRVVDSGDWGDRLKPEDIRLTSVKVDTWGGFVFINMDSDCEPLHDFLAPMAGLVEKFEFEKLRFHWYKTTIVPANWKTVLAFFNEFYHVQQAHPQLLSFTDDYSKSDGFGRHGKIWFEAEGAIPFKRSPRLPPKEQPDYRQYVLEFVERYYTELQAMVTPRRYEATQRLRTEVSADAPPGEVLSKWVQFHLEACAADGSGWPSGLTAQYMEQSGLDWHVFPNSIFLHGMVDGVLWYRARPVAGDSQSCILDVWSLQRFGEGKAPELVREFYKDWRMHKWGRIFEQDFLNIPEVQQGMQSRGFKGLRPNPVQERALSHFHRVLREFLADGSAE
jgi:phenylpropionate dioxygenase-like ring-hydroxylating dioxygenase large terminal subunit